VSALVDRLRINGVGQTTSRPSTTQFQNIMTHIFEQLASLLTAMGVAPASKPSAEDEAKAAAAQSVLIAASRARHPLRTAN
jgi:hypothetical protein